jgi:hypothetical protein
MFPQFPPPALQRCQRYAKLIGCEPLQLPGLECRVWPFWAAPEIVGGDVFDGGVVAPDAPAPATRPSATTRASVPQAPSEMPARRDRLLADWNM